MNETVFLKNSIGININEEGNYLEFGWGRLIEYWDVT